MPIPQLDANGLLPAGIHICTEAEIGAAFCWNQHRAQRFAAFQQFLAQLRQHFGDTLRLDGSFVTDKELPEDIDVILDVCASPPPHQWMAIGHWVTFKNHYRTQFGVDFWLDLPANNSFTAFFQYVGVKSAAVKNLLPYHPKGILELS